MDFSIIENETTLKSKEKYIKDDYFNLLVQYAVKFHDCYDVHEIIKNLFELYSIDEYELFFENKLLSNNKYNEIYFEIYTLFCEWKPYTYYNMILCCWWEIGVTTMENSMMVSLNTKNRAAI